MELVEGIATVSDVDTFVARLGAIGEDFDCVVQAFDARYVAGRAHLERAVKLADRAREHGEAIADDHGVEMLLYAAGRRQIDRALEMGVAAGECPTVVVVHGTGADSDESGAATAVRGLLEPAETLGAFDPERLRAFFDIGEREESATTAELPALVRERVALLAVDK
jgi:KEOPS complex subunit Cgi121